MGVNLRQPFIRALVKYSALLLAVMSAYPSDAQTAKPATSEFGTSAWSRMVEPLIDFSISPKGRYLALITRSGRLSVWSANSGQPLWAVSGISERNVVVSDVNGIAAVYDKLNRLDRSVVLYGPGKSTTSSDGTKQVAGRRLSKVPFDGAIWSADTNPDGSTFAFGDGSRQVRLINLAPAIMTRSAYPVDGIATNVKFTSDGQSVVVGLWNQSGVEMLDLSGHIITSFLGPNVRRFDVAVSPDDRNALALAYYNRQNLHPVLSLLDQNAALRWSYDPGDGTSDARAILGNAGAVSYLAFTQTPTHPHKGMASTRLLSAIDSAGNLLWSKGGLFMQPSLVSLAPDGDGVIVYDGNRTIYKFGSDGSRQARMVLPTKLQQLYAVSLNDRSLILYLVDGTLMKISVN